MTKENSVLTTGLYLLGVLEAEIQQIFSASTAVETEVVIATNPPKKGSKKKKAEIKVLEEVVDASFAAQAQSTIMTYLAKARAVCGDANLVVLQQQRSMTLPALQANLRYCVDNADAFIVASSDPKVQELCKKVVDMLKEVFLVGELTLIKHLLINY